MTTEAISERDQARVQIADLIRRRGIGCTLSWEQSREEKGRQRIVAVAVFGVEGVEPWPMKPEVADPILKELESSVQSNTFRGQSISSRETSIRR